jgi:hypothetical protein
MGPNFKKTEDFPGGNADKANRNKPKNLKYTNWKGLHTTFATRWNAVVKSQWLRPWNRGGVRGTAGQSKEKKAQPPEKTAGFGATLETSRVRVGRVHTEVKKSINKKDGVSVRGGMGWWGF